MVVPTIRHPCLVALLQEMGLLVAIAVSALLHGCANVWTLPFIASISVHVPGTLSLQSSGGGPNHEHSSSLITVLDGTASAVISSAHNTLRCCVACGAMSATSVMVVRLLVSVLAVVLAHPPRVQDVRTSMARAALVCRARVVIWIRSLLSDPGKSSFPTSPASNVYAPLLRTTFPTLLDQDLCARELCLKHFARVSFLKLLLPQSPLPLRRPL